jgi:serine/alanine adding enzyme
MNLAVVRKLPEQEWRDFVDQQAAGNIFHIPEMFRVFARTRGYKPSLWAAVDDHNRPLALMLPTQITLMARLLRPLTTRAIVYGSVLCVPGAEGKRALDTLLRAYAQQTQSEALFTELRHLSDLSDLQRVLAENGFAYEKHLNYLINLNRAPEAVLQSIGSRTRKKIRKGLRDGLVQVTEVTNRAELHEWHSTLRKTYANAQVPLADRSMFEAAFEELSPKGMAKFLLAKVSGTIAACSVELMYKDTIYGWYGGLDRDYGKYLPNEMLIWHILEWGARNGYHTYDFGGAGRPDEEYGVRDFKAKFGGELVCYGRSTYVHSRRRLALSKLGYTVYRRLTQ